MLFNPKTYDPSAYDEKTQEQIKTIIEFFEDKGLAQMKHEYHERVWYDDFLQLVFEKGIFADFGMPKAVGELIGDDTRFDVARNNELNEIISFYSLPHFYTWQVSVLGFGAIWSSKNEAAVKSAAEALRAGTVFGFGLSEQRHGANIYATDVILTPDGEGKWRANGPKYYIGNGNVAHRLAVFGKFGDTDEYVFFSVDVRNRGYVLEKNTVTEPMYVAAFRLEDYEVTSDDILHTGKEAFSAALAAVNIGKCQLGPSSLGIATRSFYEAVTHANNRVLYGKKVTVFPHVRRMLADSFVRLVAMKLFLGRQTDYFRSASLEDRRYLLYNPLAKMKATQEGERVIDLLWEVIAARGFEGDTYFEEATKYIRYLPKLEGTVHVNLALVLKFLPNYLFAASGYPGDMPDVGVRIDGADDAFLFDQGPAAGLGGIEFPDWRPTFRRFAHLPNVARFIEQMKAFGAMVQSAPTREDQAKDLDYLLGLGQLFTQIVYATVVLESAALALDGAENGTRVGTVADVTGLNEDIVDRIFNCFVRDISIYANDIVGQASASDEQREGARAIIMAPVADADLENRVVDLVLSYDGAYAMKP